MREHRILITLILLALVSTAGAWSYGRIVRVRGHLLSLRGHLQALEAVGAAEGSAGLASADLRMLGREMAGAHEDLVALQADLGPALPLARYMGWVPRVGSDLQAAPDLLEMALNVTAAGERALEAVEPLLDEGAGAGGKAAKTGPGPTLAAALAGMEPALVQVSADLDQAARARERLAVHRLSPRVARLVERLDRYLPLLRSGVELARLAPRLMGSDGPRAYLILAQNEDELRATGGFISGVGLLRLHQGQILGLDFQDSFAVDDLSRPHDRPPEPLLRYMWAGVWLLRDANWSPDFPTAAQVARRIYQQDQGVLVGRSSAGQNGVLHVDGVIALDQQALRLLVDALGPIHTGMFDEPVTGDTVIGQMRRAWAPRPGEEHTLGWWQHRKDFMEAILTGILQQLDGGPVLSGAEGLAPENLGKLAYGLWQALEGKHLLISLEDQAAASILARNGWDGALQPASGDYLMAVDTNMGFNKVNPNVEARLDYRVVVEGDGRAHGTAVIRHQNHSTRDVVNCVQEARYDPTYEEMMNRCYWNYLRLYVPEGGHLLDATRNPLPPGSLYRRETGAGPGTGEPDVGPPEKGKQVFGTFFVVPPGQARETRFEYQLPAVARPASDGWQYSLLIQKQPGAHPLPVTVTVVLPPGSELITADPAPLATTGDEAHYELTLDRDWEMTLSYR